jgi:hypothetical protein
MAITKVTNSVVGSGSATDGYVLTADGSGNSAWEEVAGGPTFKTFGTSSIMIGDTDTGTIDAANYNTGLGVGVFNALTSGDENVMVGFAAGQTLTTGSHNIGIGVNAVDDVSTGSFNVGIGTHAVGSTTTASNNTGVGYAALFANTAGYDNTAIGYAAMYNANNAALVVRNTAVGSGALYSTTGNDTTAIGYQALTAQTSGRRNVAVGVSSGYSTTTGQDNTFLGTNAGLLNTTASNMTFIGKGAGDNVTTGGSGHTCVGANVQPAYASGSNGEFGFGRDLSTNGSGYFTVGASTSKGYYLYGSTNGFTAGSDERLKEEITDSTVGLSFINDLRPRTFKWKKRKDIPNDMPQYKEGSEVRHLNLEKVQLGMIAQEVKTAIDNHPELPAGFSGWTTDVEGTQCLEYVGFIQPLIKAVQELSAKCDSLQNEINILNGQ